VVLATQNIGLFVRYANSSCCARIKRQVISFNTIAEDHAECELRASHFTRKGLSTVNINSDVSQGKRPLLTGSMTWPPKALTTLDAAA